MIGSYFFKRNINDFRKFLYKKSFPEVEDDELQYFMEYDQWIIKLKLRDRISVFDIGCDNYASLLDYLILHGFKHIHYIGHDIDTYLNIVYLNGDIMHLDDKIYLTDFDYENFHNPFIKVDCEGCEYQYLNTIYKTLNLWTSYSIALHDYEEVHKDFEWWYKILLDNEFKVAYKVGDDDFKEYLLIRRKKL